MPNKIVTQFWKNILPYINAWVSVKHATYLLMCLRYRGGNIGLDCYLVVFIKITEVNFMRALSEQEISCVSGCGWLDWLMGAVVGKGVDAAWNWGVERYQTYQMNRQIDQVMQRGYIDTGSQCSPLPPITGYSYNYNSVVRRW